MPRLAAGIGVVGLHIAALHQHTATGGAGQARQDADQGGFTGAIGAEQAKNSPCSMSRLTWFSAWKGPGRGKVLEMA